jgi:hypothetical protein
LDEETAKVLNIAPSKLEFIRDELQFLRGHVEDSSKEED